MARGSYGRQRVAGRTHRPGKASKAVFWGLILFGLTSYTIITTSGSFLQWLEQKQTQEDEEDVQGNAVNVTWEEVQERRIERLRRGCEALGLQQTLDKVVLKHLLVDLTHHALYCYVPKVASTSWKRLWLLLVGAARQDEILSLPRAYIHGPAMPNLASDKFSDEAREEILGSYKKFLFTRNPLERLVSAYRDKLETEDVESSYDFHKYIGREVERAVRGKVTGEGRNVTFREFVEWVVTPFNGSAWSEGQRNEHWRPVVDLCAPCVIQYDVIGRYENLEKEAKEVLEWMGASHLAHALPPPSRSPHATPAAAQAYFQGLPAAHRLSFYKAYLLDYLFFGYHIP